jgi:hypothetical protein
MNRLVWSLIVLFTAPSSAPAAEPSGIPAAAKPAMQDLIARWRDTDFAVRDRATAEMLARWDAWAAEDMKALEAAQGHANMEVATRAGAARDVIWLRRRLTVPSDLSKEDRERAYRIAQAIPDAPDPLLGHANPVTRARAVTAVGWSERIRSESSFLS